MAAASSSEVRVASRRIVDYLNDGEELGAVETPPCTPAAAVMAGEAARSVLPRFRWPRLVRRGRKKGGAVKAKEEEHEAVAEKEKRGGDLPVAPVSPSGACVVSLCYLSNVLLLLVQEHVTFWQGFYCQIDEK